MRFKLSQGKSFFLLLYITSSHVFKLITLEIALSIFHESIDSKGERYLLCHREKSFRGRRMHDVIKLSRNVNC